MQCFQAKLKREATKFSATEAIFSEILLLFLKKKFFKIKTPDYTNKKLFFYAQNVMQLSPKIT